MTDNRNRRPLNEYEAMVAAIIVICVTMIICIVFHELIACVMAIAH